MAWLLLSIAAVLAGMVNAIAGGGTLLTFPALQFVLATSVAANATSTVALLPGSVASVWGYRRELAEVWNWAWLLTLPSLIGGCLGAWFLLWGGEAVFKPLVPWLILLAALLFLLQPAIARIFQQHKNVGPPKGRLLVVIIACQLLIGIYGGYFGAGIGILMLSSLSFLGLSSIHHTNAIKSYLACCMNGVSAAILAWQGQAVWLPALVMAAAAIVGGYFGARLALRMKPIVVRRVVIAIGFSLAAFYFVRG